MRTLLDEYGHLLITLIVTSILVVAVIFGILIPKMGAFTQKVVLSDASDNTADVSAVAKNIERAAPTISAENVSIAPNEIVDFSECIVNGKIIAINADGDDISQNIVIKPGNAETSLLFDSETKTFIGTEIGEYKFILSVKDKTSDEYYGKEQKTVILITVEAVEEPVQPESPET